MGDDGIMLIMNDDGAFEEYDDAYDLTIHCTSQQDLDRVTTILRERTWITDRDPTPEEVEEAGDIGFIICISGRINEQTFDHAVCMQDNFYEDWRWYYCGAYPSKIAVDGKEIEKYTVHGWMMPPSWEGG